MKLTSLMSIGLALLMAAPVTALATEPSKPRNASPQVERPFGGPPNRAPAGTGRRCVNASITCELDVFRKLRSACSCHIKDGSIVMGKVAK